MGGGSDKAADQRFAIFANAVAPHPEESAAYERVRVAAPTVSSAIGYAGSGLLLLSLMFGWMSVSAAFISMDVGAFSRVAWISAGCGAIGLLGIVRPVSLVGLFPDGAVAAVAAAIAGGTIGYVTYGLLSARSQLSELVSTPNPLGIEIEGSILPGPGLVLAALGTVLLAGCAFVSVRHDQRTVVVVLVLAGVLVGVGVGTTSTDSGESSASAPSTSVAETSATTPARDTAAPVTRPLVVAAAMTPVEQEFIDRWATLPVSQRLNICTSLEVEGAAAMARRMDAAAPGTLSIDFMATFLVEKCADGSASAPPMPTSTAPPISLDIDWDETKIDLRRYFCEAEFDVPLCVYSKNTDSWIPSGTG